MNKVDWDFVEQRLSNQFGSCKLKADGIALSLHCVLLNRRLCIVWYVNGQFLGRWLMEDCIERQKFARTHTKKLYTEKQRKAFKRCGIKDMDCEVTTHRWHWSGFASLKRHLLKTCTNIEICHE